MKKPKVLAIVGPTAVGKTDLSLELMNKFNGVIISGDSQQVYRGLDIGTAKVSTEIRQKFPHRLIDIRDVTERFSAYDFQQSAKQEITAISENHKLPIVVGGTGFYLNALLENLPLGNDQTENNFEFRKKWQDYLKSNSPEKLWATLNKKDPKAAEKIPIANTRRVIRALEVIDKTGKRFSEQPKISELPFDSFIIGLTTERKLLYERINRRVDQMYEAGLIEEAKFLYQNQNEIPQAKNGIGYKEWFPFFDHQISEMEAIETIKKNSRHYAKRQLTWFRHQLPVHWYDIIEFPNQKEKIRQDIEKWLMKG